MESIAKVIGYKFILNQRKGTLVNNKYLNMWSVFNIKGQKIQSLTQ